MAQEIPEDREKKITGCIFYTGSNLNIDKPVIFLGGTVLSFNASLGIGPTQESTLTVDIINDCDISGTPAQAPEGEYFYGFSKIGSPVYFSTCEAMGLLPNGNCFKFGGILQNVTLNQSNSGKTFQARVVDPRSLLANCMLIVGNTLEGPVEHKNYFNVYGLYEHNVLPEESRYDHAADGGDKILLEKSPGEWTVPVPSGDPELRDEDGNIIPDCSVFGLADSDERGMSYRKVVQAIQDLEPLIFSPNYGEPYVPNLNGRMLDIVAGKLHHEDNVFQLDISGLPNPPSYYRVSGPYISILDLITNVCDVMGHEFHVTLEKPPVGANEPWTIKIVTKKLEANIDQPPESIFGDIAVFDGSAVDLSYGKELRLDKNKSMIIGEQEHRLYLTSQIDHYFGEDSNGQPIIPRANDDCGFVVDLELTELNSQLRCPLFDYTGDDKDKIVTRKVTLSEVDIRAALSSVELWKTRVLSSGIPENAEDRAPGKAGDFNRLIQHNFPDLTNENFSRLIKANTKGLEVSGDTQQTTVPSGAARAFTDMIESANSKKAASFAHTYADQLDLVHAFVENLGRTYYGKQYIVTLDQDICSKPAGIYDENYFGLGSGTYSKGVAYTGVGECNEEIVIPEGKVFRPEIYTHQPTNDGAWVEPCVSVMGLTAEGFYNQDNNFYEGVSLDFFKTEDTRVGCFARFDTKAVRLTQTAGFAEEGKDPVWYNGSEDANGVEIQAKFVVDGFCGSVDLTGISDDEKLCVKISGGDCEIPEPPSPSHAQVPISTGIIRADSEDVVCFVKADVADVVYIHTEAENQPPKSKVVVQFSAACTKRRCEETGDFSNLILAVSEALAIGSGVILDPKQRPTIDTDTNLDPAQDGKQNTTTTVCGLPVVSGLFNAQAAVDSGKTNNKGFFGAAAKPSLIAVPLRSNITTYGPWYSANFFEGHGSYGGISIEQDQDFAPWNYGSIGAMDKIAQQVVDEAMSGTTELETGTINYPYWPQLPLGFLANGPNLSSLSVVFGSGGVTTNYTFQTYTPRFGNLKNLENQALKDSTKNRQRALRAIRERDIRTSKINRKLSSTKPISVEPKNVPLQHQGTASRILVGEMYDYNVIHSGDLTGPIVGTGQRTVVGLETLEKSVVELRYDYQKKAFTSLDSVYSPVSISGEGGLPQFGSTYSFDKRLRVSDISPGTHPPFITGICNDDNEIVTSTGTHPAHPIINYYLNPYTNPYNPNDNSQPYKKTNIYGSGNSFNVGHGLDFVGRESGVPGLGQLNSFYTQNDGVVRNVTPTQPAGKYSKDYRFLGLKGPLILHSWGYDTDNRPIPNAIDDEILIKNSGIFLTRSNVDGINGDIKKIPSGECDPKAIGLKDEFLQDWLQKPKTWPVGPVDLRWDRKRSMWVCPPGHSIVLAQVIKDVPENGVGSGVIIQQGESDKIYRQLSASDGKIVSTTGILKKECLPGSSGSDSEEYERDSCKNKSISDYHWIILSIGSYVCNDDNPEEWKETRTIEFISDVVQNSTSNGGFNISFKKKQILLPHQFLIKDVTPSGDGSDITISFEFETTECESEPPTEPPTEEPTEPPTPTETITPTPTSAEPNVLLESCCDTEQILIENYETTEWKIGDVVALLVNEVTGCWKVTGFNQTGNYDTITSSDIVVSTPFLCDCPECRRKYPCPTPTPTPTETPTATPAVCEKKLAVIKIKDYVGTEHSVGDMVYAYYEAESDVYIVLGSASRSKNIITGKWDFSGCFGPQGSILVSCSLMGDIGAGTIISKECEGPEGGSGGTIHNPLQLTQPPPGCYAQIIAMGYRPFDVDFTANDSCG